MVDEKGSGKGKETLIISVFGIVLTFKNLGLYTLKLYSWNGSWKALVRENWIMMLSTSSKRKAFWEETEALATRM